MSFLILFMSLKWYFSRQILQNVMREMTADWLLLTTTNATAASWKIATQYSIQQIFSFHMPCQDTNECISKLDQAKSSVVFFTIMLGVGGIGFEKLILLVYRESRDRMHEKIGSPILRDGSLGTQRFVETCDIIVVIGMASLHVFSQAFPTQQSASFWGQNMIITLIYS